MPVQRPYSGVQSFKGGPFRPSDAGIAIDLWANRGVLSGPGRQQPIIYRQSRPASGQGSSDAAKIVRMSTRQFQVWINSPRAAEAPARMRAAATRQFSQNIAAHLTLDMGRAFAKGKVVHAAKNLGCLLRSHPAGFVRMIQRRAASEIFSHSRIGGAEGH